ncbi:MFS transporter [Sphingomonas sp. H39-1-10]|uniref:MFS transporter n=1 Tax=Sphingomonas TaxID=13687 RepID=UPI00088BAC78|nr:MULTISPECIES: MFS transporter [Sphingomonas]MDF0486733.1 MFS transporter [Sphingomonas pollutisoli]SDA35379.1 Predicted arabinose efflux permease, MFS family [Sphingomonas sp. NFR15]
MGRMSPRWYRDLDAEGRRAVWSTYGGFILDAMNVQLYAFVLPVLLILWHMSPSRAGVLATAALLSGAIGGWVAGMVSDRIGRVRVLRLTILWLAISSAVCGLARSYDELLLARIVQGVGFGAEWAVGAVFIAEVAAPATRGRVTGSVQSAWALGWAIAAVVTAVALWRLPPELGWRATFFVGLLPAAWVYWLRTRLDETPSFSSPQAEGDWHAIFSSVTRGRTLRGSILATGTHGGYWALATWWPTMLRLEHAMTAAQATSHVATLIGGSFAGYLLGGWLGDRAGRRLTLATFAVGGIAAVLAATFLPLPAFAFLALNAVIGLFALGLYSAITPVLTELFPTRLRGSGLGFCYNVGRGLAGAGPLAIGASIAAFGIAPAIGLYVAFSYSLVLIAVALLPETRGLEFGAAA